MEMTKEDMSGEVKRLAQEMVAVAEEIERVLAVLRRYKQLSAEVTRRVDQGQLLVDALEQLEGPIRRREVTEAMEQLEAARHRVRLAMFALGEAQGTSASQLGRNLGISRQLASRLANEAAEAFT